MSESQHHGWKVSALLFGVLQVGALFLLTMIFTRIDRMDSRLQSVTERVAIVEGKMSSQQPNPYRSPRHESAN